MSKLVKDAVCGRGQAMEELYKANSRKVFYAAQKLLLDEEQAEQAAKWVWSNVWSSAAAAQVTEEEEFAKMAVRLTGDFCRKRIEEKNPQAFVYTLTDESLEEDQTEAEVSEETEAQGEQLPVDSVLASLPVMQRFLLVLHNVSGISNIHLATSLKMDVHMIQKLLKAAEYRIASNGEYSAEQLKADMLAEMKQTVVPESVKQTAKAVMEPIAAKAKKKDNRKDSVQAVLLLLVGLCVLYTVFFKDNITAYIASFETVESYVTFEEEDAIKESLAAEASDPVPEMNFDLLDETLVYYADIEIEGHGTIVVQLDQAAAPYTCANFVNLANNGFYDGLTFHRIVKNYILQGGDPTGTGMGGSDNPIVGEFAANGYKNSISHTRGTISMARADGYNSASSQFFIMHQDYTGWDGLYAAFGQVIEGMDIVDALCEAAKPIDANGIVASDARPVMTTIKIRTEAASAKAE